MINLEKSNELNLQFEIEVTIFYFISYRNHHNRVNMLNLPSELWDFKVQFLTNLVLKDVRNRRKNKNINNKKQHKSTWVNLLNP
jgi:hypothetical protein